jgi:predicted metal-dependent HD superfamily phosphohydrolase
MMEQVFRDLVLRSSSDDNVQNELWVELKRNYSLRDRYYHTLTHLENMYMQLYAVKDQINDWDTILFALFYHDAIYHVTRSDNEERSAAIAKKRLEQLNFPSERINRCIQHILATKSHDICDDDDTNFLIDADLSILGQSWDLYERYIRAVRKEYSIFPDFVYNAGRKKVLKHFLEMKRIFKSDHFYMKYEKIARANIQREIDAKD